MTVNRVLEATCALLLAAAVLVAFLAVIFRYVVGSALSWSFEASLALLTYITFVGCYLALRQNSHLKVDVFVRLLPRAGQAVVFTLIQCTIIAIAVVMLHYGGRQLWLFKEQTTLVMELPSWVLYAAIPLSGLMMGIDAAFGLFAGLRRYARGGPPMNFDGADGGGARVDL